jgi:hypothetical protein
VPTSEVLNFGVDAYGPDQSVLRYVEDGHRFRPHLVLIGFMSENLLRAVNVFRPFYEPGTGAPFAKPRFVLERGGLRLIPNPLPEVAGYRALLDDSEATLQALGRYDHYYQVLDRYRAGLRLPSLTLLGRVMQEVTGRDPLAPGLRHGMYDTTAEAYRVTALIFERFHEAALDHGSLPIVLLFPNRTDLGRYRQGLPRRYQPLMDEFERRGYAYVDLLDGLAGLYPDSLFAEGGHYAPLGNGRVAEVISEYLESHGLDSEPGVAGRLAEVRALRTHALGMR